MQERKRMSAGWSFAVGVLFGALAVFLPLSSSGTPGQKVEGPTPRPPAFIEPQADASAPRASSVPEARDFAESTEPTGAEKRRRRPTIQAPQTASHSELVLQLD